jgi:hypothetical protein
VGHLRRSDGIDRGQPVGSDPNVPAGPRAARPLRSLRASCRWRWGPTGSGRCGSRLPPAVWSASGREPPICPTMVGEPHWFGMTRFGPSRRPWPTRLLTEVLSGASFAVEGAGDEPLDVAVSWRAPAPGVRSAVPWREAALEAGRLLHHAGHVVHARSALRPGDRPGGGRALDPGCGADVAALGLDPELLQPRTRAHVAAGERLAKVTEISRGRRDPLARAARAVPRRARRPGHAGVRAGPAVGDRVARPAVGRQHRRQPVRLPVHGRRGTSPTSRRRRAVCGRTVGGRWRSRSSPARGREELRAGGRCPARVDGARDAGAARCRPRRATAATGTARNAPTMPISTAPAVRAARITTGCSATARRMMVGCSTLDSICCTASTIASTISASGSPPEPARRARRAAGDERADDRDEPAEEHQHRERQHQRHPTIASPMPIPTASIRATARSPHEARQRGPGAGAGGPDVVAVVRGGAGDEPVDDLLAVLDEEEQQHDRERQRGDALDDGDATEPTWLGDRRQRSSRASGVARGPRPGCGRSRSGPPRAR